nr:odorant receptor 67b-like [Osmia lignaria]
MVAGYSTQVARLVVFCSVNTFLTDIPFLVVALGTIIKTSNCIINESKNINNIILNSTNQINFLVVHMTVSTTLFSTMPFVPPLLDIILPLNKSREPMYSYPAYYGVDNEKYHFVIVAHMTAILFFTNVLYCACDMNYVYIVQHACSLLAITGQRFKCACYDQDTCNKMKMRRIYRNVCDSIRTHQRALTYVNQVGSAYDISLFVSMGLLLGSITLSLLMVTSSEFGMMWFIYNVFLLTQLLHVFFLVVQGQFVINSEDNLYKTIGEATWYNATNETRTLYVLALRRSLTPPLLTAGGFVKLDLKTFTEILRASVSYYTVMKSK